TWTWDGIRWTRHYPLLAPSARQGAIGAFDLARGNLVVFGGFLWLRFNPATNETWTWDGANWTLRSVPGPSARGGAAMAFDGTSGNVLLFGGASFLSNTPGLLGDTWLWDGQQWTSLPVSGPSASQAAGAEFV